MAREHEGHFLAEIITRISQPVDAQRGFVIGLLALLRTNCDRMKPSLADIQQDFKSAILKGDKKFASRIIKLARGTEAKEFGTYQDAHHLRLTDFLANDYKLLREYLGETQFVAMAQTYFSAHPAQHPNARWLSKHLADFLLHFKPFAHRPEIQELAALELALNSAFDAPEASPLTFAELKVFAPEFFSALKLGIHPSAARLTFKQNTSSIWSALKCQTQPPKPHRLDADQQILVWRQGAASRFRLLGEEEAMAYDACKTGASFGTMCKMIAFIDNPETATERTANYLRAWIEAELLLAPALAVKLVK